MRNTTRRPSLKKLDSAALSDKYVAHALAHRRATEEGDKARAHQEFRLLTDVLLEVRRRGTPSALEALMSHAHPAVRLSAAAHSLQSDAEKAQRVLKELSEGPSGLTRFAAEMTLREWQAGRLTAR